MTLIDKSTWPRGPWDHEPDAVRWTDEKTGLECLVLRNAGHGAWCGYVGIPDDHLLHGVDYDDLDVDFEVHGGLTFSGHAPPFNERERGRWWFGFDCAHAFDVQPARPAVAGVWPVDDDSMHMYCDFEYVTANCESLASQLADAWYGGAGL